MAKFKKNRTLVFLKTPSRSCSVSQPVRHPGTFHPFDMDPSVTTGTIDENFPIGTKGLLPKSVHLKTSSETTIILSSLASSASCGSKIIQETNKVSKLMLSLVAKTKESI